MMAPKILEIDGARWRTAMDSVEGLRAALGAIDGHGNSIDAFIDSMIYGGMLVAAPPYEVVVRNLVRCDARTFIEELATAIAEARLWRQTHYGDDVHVAVSAAD